MSPKIDFKEIEKIINLVEERKLSEFELEIEGFKIKKTNFPSDIFKNGLSGSSRLSGWCYP